MSDSKKRRVFDGAGGAFTCGSHFRDRDDVPVPFGDCAGPGSLGCLVLDVLKSDSPVTRGERILYREPDGAVEYRVVSARARGGAGEWVTAVLMERSAAVPDPALGLHPDRVHEAGDGGTMDLGGDASGAMSLSALYESYFERPDYSIDDPLYFERV